MNLLYLLLLLLLLLFLLRLIPFFFFFLLLFLLPSPQEHLIIRINQSKRWGEERISGASNPLIFAYKTPNLVSWWAINLQATLTCIFRETNSECHFWVNDWRVFLIFFFSSLSSKVITVWYRAMNSVSIRISCLFFYYYMII